MQPKLQLVSSLILAVITVISAVNYTAVYTQGRLPSARSGQPVIYDGDNYIYIFGGWHPEGYPRDLLRFTISSGSVSQFGTLKDGIGGTLQMDGDGNIFHFHFLDVFKFTPPGQSVEKIAELPLTSLYGDSLLLNSSHAMILGGTSSCSSIMSFNMETYRTTVLKDLPACYYYMTATTDGLGNAFLIGQGGNKTVVKLDMETQNSEVVYQDLPNMILEPESVTDGSKAYVIGGYEYDEANTVGILSFDFETLEHTFHPVDNFILEADDHFVDAPTAVYVDKLKRIYFFGGRTLRKLSLRDIWYIDLEPETPTTTTTTEVPTTTVTGMPSTSTMDPDIFNCVNKTDGFYPHPSDCSLFIGCHQGETDVFECPPPLLFDPLLGTCNQPNLVDCTLSCFGKPDGPNPHPHDCALFITCLEGQLSVFKCPEPLLFDPIAKICRYPEFVVCDV